LPLGNCRCHGLHSIAELPTQLLQRWKYKCSPKTTKTFAQLRETGIVIGQNVLQCNQNERKTPVHTYAHAQADLQCHENSIVGMPPVKKENSESPRSGRYKSSVRLKQATQVPH